MTADQYARYQTRRDDYIAKRTKVSKSLDSALEVADVQTYSVNDPEGGQSVTRRKIDELTKQLEYYDRQIDNLDRLLGTGGGLVSVNMRRRL